MIQWYKSKKFREKSKFLNGMNEGSQELVHHWKKEKIGRRRRAKKIVRQIKFSVGWVENVEQRKKIEDVMWIQRMG